MAADSKKMGVVGLTVLVAVNMMGSGIIMLPASLAQVGAMSLLAWVITCVGALCIAYTFSKCGRYCKKDGGMSAYAEEAHSKSSFFISSYTYYVCLIISAVAIAVSCVSYFKPFMPWLGTSPIHTFFGVCAVLIVTTLANFVSPKLTGQISSVTVWGIILPVVGLSIIGWFWFSPDILTHAWNPHHTGTGSAISGGISLTLWAFLGIESAGAVSGTVENPERNVPIAVMCGTAFAAVIYIASTTVIMGIIPNTTLAASSAPFGLVFSYMFNPTVGNIVSLLSVIACVGSLLGWQFTNAQVSKAAADEGLFPKIFGKATAAGVPVAGMIIMLILELLLAVMTISPNLTSQFNVLLNLAVFINMVPYILSMTGVEALLRRNKVSPSEYKTTAIVGTLAVIYSIYGVYACGQSAVFWGSIVTFFGYIFYGFIAARDVNLGKATN